MVKEEEEAGQETKINVSFHDMRLILSAILLSYIVNKETLI